MSTNPPEWSRLVSAARRAPQDTRDESAPYGFATRVVARAFSERAPGLDASVLSRYGLRALGLSCLLAVAGIAATLHPVMTAIENEAASLKETPTDVVDTTELT